MDIQNNMENGSITFNLSDDLSNRNNHGREGNSVERIETQEKRTRFSLSHDEGNFFVQRRVIKMGIFS